MRMAPWLRPDRQDNHGTTSGVLGYARNNGHVETQASGRANPNLPSFRQKTLSYSTCNLMFSNVGPGWREGGSN
jgi:hypothetical protein